jgi:DNA-binding GntR family transcriptional regulator
VAVRYRSAAELAAESIRYRISASQFEAGKRLNIDDLAKEMGLSSTPVREALKMLEVEGLVSIAPRSGVYVRQISVVEVLEVYAIKEALEPLLARWATLRRTPERVKELGDHVRALESHAHAQQLDKYARAIEAYQAALLKMGGSEALTAVFQTIDGRVRLMRYRNLAQPGRMRSSAVEHRNVVAAIAAGDADRASALTAEYVRGATEKLMRLLRGGDPGMLEVRTNRATWAMLEELLRAGDGIGSAPTPRHPAGRRASKEMQSPTRRVNGSTARRSRW